ncbi:hypothetical protein, partial [Paenibacillus zanthoxyli]|uniref:hypothetical protein n=1 Tax=Paenibacillus zanthoxyli TaxID=369399 RepID=UPI001E3ABA61
EAGCVHNAGQTRSSAAAAAIMAVLFMDFDLPGYQAGTQGAGFSPGPRERFRIRLKTGSPASRGAICGRR